MDTTGILKELQPDTDNLIVGVVGIILLLSMYYIPADAKDLINVGIGGLVGYLGASRNSSTNPAIPPNVRTGGTA